MVKRKPKQGAKKATLVIRVPVEMRKELAAQARRRALDLTTYARMLIKLGLDKHTKGR
jgi:hypothetical protein